MIGLRLEILLITISLCISIGLFFSIRKGYVRGGFVVLWAMVGLLTLTLPLLDRFYQRLAGMIGLNYAIDMLYMAVILFLLIYVFYITYKLQRLIDAIDIILARLAIAEGKLGNQYDD